MERLVSPNGFDGQGPVPDQVTAAAKRIAKLRTNFINQWTPGMEQPLTTREVEELFNASAMTAEWCRELYEAREALTAKLAAAEAVIEAAQEIHTECDSEPAFTSRTWCSNHQEYHRGPESPCPHRALRDALATYRATHD